MVFCTDLSQDDDERVNSDDQATLSVVDADGAVGEFVKSWGSPPGVDRWGQSTAAICEEGVLVGRPNHDLDVHTPDGTWTFESHDDRPGWARTEENLLAGIEPGAPPLADETDGLRAIEALDAAVPSRGRGERATTPPDRHRSRCHNGTGGS